MPSSIPSDAAHLIKNCIVVNPIKRLTMAEIMRHPWYLAGLPKYLQGAPHTPSLTMPVESLSYILAPQKQARAIPESSRPIQEIVDELAEAVGIDVGEILASLGAEGDNAVKVAYNIAKDKRRKTLDCELELLPVSTSFEPTLRPGNERMCHQEGASDIATTSAVVSHLAVCSSMLCYLG